MHSKLSLLSAAVLGAWDPVEVLFTDVIHVSGVEEPYADTVAGVDYQCDYDVANPLHSADLGTLYSALGSYLYNVVGDPCYCTALVAGEDGTSAWQAYLEDEYLITGVTVREDAGNVAEETLPGVGVYVLDDDENTAGCAAASSEMAAAGTDIEASCGAGVIGSSILIVGQGDISLCKVAVTGYPVPGPFIAGLEAQFDVDRLYHKESADYYDTLQTKYDTLSDYYDQVQERFVELSNLHNQVSLWKSEVDGDATLLQAVIDKYAGRTVGENCAFGLAGIAWWCKEAKPIAY